MHKRQMDNVFKRILSAADKNLAPMLLRSFLPEEYRDRIRGIVSERIAGLGGEQTW